MSATTARQDEPDAQVRLLRAVVDSASEPLWVIGADGTVALANRASARALGYARSDRLIGLPSHDTLHHSHPDGSHYDSADCPIVRSRLRDTRGSKELFLSRSGNVIPVTWSTKPLPGIGATLLSFSVAAGIGHTLSVLERAVPRVASQHPIAVTASTLRAELQRQIGARFQDPEFSATVLANENHLSIRALQLHFASIGASPAAEIRRSRLQFARTLIEAGYTVQQAAFESGFRETGSFTRAFRKRYGVNPSQLA